MMAAMSSAKGAAQRADQGKMNVDFSALSENYG
jgi:hypothetical protein